jgi:NAD(P)-dependent dehydrogenase (short-subunit alcohol dehydrogenase family)
MTEGHLSGSVAIVTGAAQGIGERVAEFLVRDGASVMIADIQGEKAQQVSTRLQAGNGDVDWTRLDITDPADAESLVTTTLTRFGAIDVLVNNAGIDAPLSEAWKMSADEWREIIDTDLSGAWWCSRAVIPHMMSRRSGKVIFISSVSARDPHPHISVAYGAAKAGIIGLALALSSQLEGYGIRVNAIMPGPTGTGRTMTDQERDTFESHPMGPGGPDPVADACLYLSRSSGDSISGAVLNLTRGRIRG